MRFGLSFKAGQIVGGRVGSNLGGLILGNWPCIKLLLPVTGFAMPGLSRYNNRRESRKATRRSAHYSIGLCGTHSAVVDAVRILPQKFRKVRQDALDDRIKRINHPIRRLHGVFGKKIIEQQPVLRVVICARR